MYSTAYVMFPDFESARKATDDCASKRFMMKKQIVQVEIAPYQRIAKPIDENIPGMGTIEQDPDYIEFLKNLEAEKNENLQSAESRLTQLESTKQDESSQNSSAQSNLVQYMLIQGKNQQKTILQRKSKKKGKKEKKKGKNDKSNMKKGDYQLWRDSIKGSETNSSKRERWLQMSAAEKEKAVAALRAEGKKRRKPKRKKKKKATKTKERAGKKDNKSG